MIIPETLKLNYHLPINTGKKNLNTFSSGTQLFYLYNNFQPPYTENINCIYNFYNGIDSLVLFSIPMKFHVLMINGILRKILLPELYILIKNYSHNLDFEIYLYMRNKYCYDNDILHSFIKNKINVNKIELLQSTDVCNNYIVNNYIIVQNYLQKNNFDIENDILKNTTILKNLEMYENETNVSNLINDFNKLEKSPQSILDIIKNHKKELYKKTLHKNFADTVLHYHSIVTKNEFNNLVKHVDTIRFGENKKIRLYQNLIIKNQKYIIYDITTNEYIRDSILHLYNPATRQKKNIFFKNIFKKIVDVEKIYKNLKNNYKYFIHKNKIGLLKKYNISMSRYDQIILDYKFGSSYSINFIYENSLLSKKHIIYMNNFIKNEKEIITKCFYNNQPSINGFIKLSDNNGYYIFIDLSYCNTQNYDISDCFLVDCDNLKQNIENTTRGFPISEIKFKLNNIFGDIIKSNCKIENSYCYKLMDFDDYFNCKNNTKISNNILRNCLFITSFNNIKHILIVKNAYKTINNIDNDTIVYPALLYDNIDFHNCDKCSFYEKKIINLNEVNHKKLHYKIDNYYLIANQILKLKNIQIIVDKQYIIMQLLFYNNIRYYYYTLTTDQRSIEFIKDYNPYENLCGSLPSLNAADHGFLKTQKYYVNAVFKINHENYLLFNNNIFVKESIIKDDLKSFKPITKRHKFDKIKILSQDDIKEIINYTNKRIKFNIRNINIDAYDTNLAFSDYNTKNRRNLHYRQYFYEYFYIIINKI